MIRNFMLCFMLLGFKTSYAQTLKLATIIPDDAAWTINIKKMAKEIEAETSGRVKIKLYTGGVSGDEPDIIRKIRIGQLSGGIITGTALGSIYSDVRVLEIPFNFVHDRSLAVKTLTGMRSYLDQGFMAKGFKILGFYEQGKIYVISKEKIANLSSMKKTKFWSFEGDELIASMLKGLELVPISLPLTDVLTSLSTGLIDTAIGPPLGIIALQWNTRTKYLVNFPVSYGFGALMISQKSFAAVAKKDQDTVTKIAQKYISSTNEEIDKSSEEALDSMKKMGMSFIDLPESDISYAKKVRSDVINKLKGKLFSAEALNLLEKNLHGK